MRRLRGLVSAVSDRSGVVQGLRKERGRETELWRRGKWGRSGGVVGKRERGRDEVDEVEEDEGEKKMRLRKAKKPRAGCANYVHNPINRHLIPFGGSIPALDPLINSGSGHAFLFQHFYY